MIAIEHQQHCVLATVAGEFALADYKAFEEDILYEIHFHGKPGLLLDLTDMISYTLDVAWEELRFTRENRSNFGRIAIVAGDRWLGWAVWVSKLFVDSEVRIFEDSQEAEHWVVAGAGQIA